MPASFPTDYLEQMTEILTAWEQVDPTLKVGDTTLDQAKQIAAAARAADDKVAELNIQRTAAMDERDNKFTDFRDLTTRLRSLVRGAYGPDSTQYAQIGGTRKSDRKPRAKKAKD